MSSQIKIGFPPNVISPDAVRLDVLASEKNYTIINKPAGILLDSYLGSPKMKSVMLAMRERPDKPEFQRLGIESPYAVNQVDFDISGASIIACNKDFAKDMLNAMWSETMEFEYLLLAKNAGQKEESFTVDLPILKHEDRNVWIVSHRFGKKAKTQFQIVETAGQYQLWRAKARSIRPHQIRVHAHEGKLNIVGETIYSRTPLIYLSKLKADYKVDRTLEEEQPLYQHLYIHLEKIDNVVAPLPKGFATTLKRLGFKWKQEL